MASISLDTPIADALSTSVHNRICQEGWSSDDDTALAEYIVLMLANGKTQSQVASELAGELLQDAQGTEEFAKWLFDQVAQLSGGESSAPTQSAPVDGAAAPDQTQEQPTEPTIPAAYETDMTEAPPDNAYVADSHLPRPPANHSNSPRGPRSSVNSRGGRGGRGGTPSKSAESALHRVRGNDRINSHNVRGAPKGPRNLQNRPGMQKALNGLADGAPPAQSAMMQPGMQNQQQGMNMQFSAEQQMQYLAMMEQQARLMAQWNELQQGMNGGGPQGRSLFDRVESGRGRGGMRGRGRGGAAQNGSRNGSNATGEPKDGAAPSEGDATMEGNDPAQAAKSNDPATTMCHFNTRCTNKECPYAHQSPAAPMNIPVDTSQVCEYGVACKNTACTARHPSPSLKQAHQAESECKFWPNCAKPNCPFRHPTQPLCQFGASCKNVSCKFTHLSTMCRFNPCTNARCPYKHADGQNRSMQDYVWTPESAKQKEEQKQQDEDKEHVSDRKFVSEDVGEEELIKPEGGEAQPAQSAEATMEEANGTVT
ncbi:uncharacterized protein HMPREF1541_06065 [Cyphellophora europaea CBS 101466]|uniref:Nab2-like CCCH zinc finger domain-containing protein n=1 Tax=Cyphellophora europaea (strain CBS 101466) TaxID=1220924 RepID=W2RVW3_CYPE1|nr:uncharacterized protein HMPREF1541_06065 [Cyphellophora europaea CBS 101466]ETN39839.1 hypothetical protein HMPREF1541_06065 [Cyphellophora europaea CBS 101466]